MSNPPQDTETRFYDEEPGDTGESGFDFGIENDPSTVSFDEQGNPVRSNQASTSAETKANTIDAEYLKQFQPVQGEGRFRQPKVPSQTPSSSTMEGYEKPVTRSATRAKPSTGGSEVKSATGEDSKGGESQQGGTR